MRAFLTLALPAALLAVVVAVAAFLLLEPCALNLAVLERYGICRPSSETRAEARLVELEVERIALERQVYALERELSGAQCVATTPDPQRPLMPQGWDNEVVQMLYGCWDVSLDYQTRDVDTDGVMGYTEWQMCFDAQGNGRQIMRDTTGIVCEGPVKANFSQGNLALIEADNLPCGDGGYVHRREISCRMTDEGSAVCSTLQPEAGGAADVTLARRDLN
ncbi:hypothetical protein [Chachezhania sediminis]|uniref:hypothetical protein n=1 Tax=Chachezhania sediminis TaxID=2599291 RepID=UPI00131D0944|nr:hypothetical protein [Chachezhania sediminis]